MFEAVVDAMPTVTVQVPPERPAERLRLKGMSARWTRPDGEVVHCRVKAVSFPDEFGQVQVDLEPA